MTETLGGPVATGEKVLYVRMTEEQHKRIRVAAAERGRPIAELAREAIDEYLERLEADRG